MIIASIISYLHPALLNNNTKKPPSVLFFSHVYIEQDSKS